MNVENAVIHQINKKPGESPTVSLAEKELVIDVTMSDVAGQVRDLYRGSGVYGIFREDADNYPFQTLLSQVEKHEWSGFFNFTKKATAILVKEMSSQAASAGGYILFMRYIESGSTYLFVIMLNDKIGASVTKNLELKKSIHLDLNKLYVAARINIDLWKEEGKDGTGHNYASFIRGRRTLSTYFIDFIGCTEITKPAEITNLAIDILHDYITKNKFDKLKKDAYRERADSYLRECISASKEASVETLSLRLDEVNPTNFSDFASNDEYQMSNLFVVDKPSLRRLGGIKFTQAGLSISASTGYIRSHITTNNGRVIIDKAPKELIQEIKALS